MTAVEARNILNHHSADDDPVALLPLAVLAKLTKDDVPEGVAIEVGTQKNGVSHFEWHGRLRRRDKVIVGEAYYTETRKYWYSPLGLEQYMDLVRRAVETRHRVRGDVELTHYEDDGAYIQLYFSINTGAQNLARAFADVRSVSSEVEEAAQRAAEEVGKHIAEVAAGLSGWGANTLENLVDQVSLASSSDDKGRSLEEALQPFVFHDRWI